MYENGLGMPKDPERAQQLIDRAEEQEEND